MDNLLFVRDSRMMNRDYRILFTITTFLAYLIVPVKSDASTTATVSTAIKATPSSAKGTSSKTEMPTLEVSSKIHYPFSFPCQTCFSFKNDLSTFFSKTYEFALRIDSILEKFDWTDQVDTSYTDSGNQFISVSENENTYDTARDSCYKFGKFYEISKESDFEQFQTFGNISSKEIWVDLVYDGSEIPTYKSKSAIYKRTSPKNFPNKKPSSNNNNKLCFTYHYSEEKDQQFPKGEYKRALCSDVKPKICSITKTIQLITLRKLYRNRQKIRKLISSLNAAVLQNFSSIVQNLDVDKSLCPLSTKDTNSRAELSAFLEIPNIFYEFNQGTIFYPDSDTVPIDSDIVLSIYELAPVVQQIETALRKVQFLSSSDDPDQVIKAMKFLFLNNFSSRLVKSSDSSSICICHFDSSNCFPNTTIQLIFGTSLGIIFLLFIIIILTQCICKFMTCLCRTQSSDNKPLKKVRFKSKDSLNADPNNYESPSVSLRSSNNSLPYDDVPSLSSL